MGFAVFLRIKWDLREQRFADMQEHALDIFNKWVDPRNKCLNCMR